MKRFKTSPTVQTNQLQPDIIQKDNLRKEKTAKFWQLVGKYAAIAVVVIYFFCQVKLVKAQETFQFASILLDNTQVSQITNLNYQIQLRRDSNVTYANNDYINITIPNDDVTTAHWNNTYVKNSNCSILSGAIVKNCRIKDLTDNKVVIIKIGAQANLILQGNIYGFQNPVSIKGIDNIVIGLYDNKNQLKAQSISISFNQFVSSSLAAQLSSSSTVIGQKLANLTVVVNLSTQLSPTGKLLFQLPNYYDGAKQDFMISARQPKPCLISVGTVLSCQFQSLTQTLMIEYSTNDLQPIWDHLNFTVGNFNNPLSNTKSGFKLSITDQDDYLISQSLNDLSLAGILDPINFTDTDFNYVDFANAGQLAIHQFVIQSAIPLQQNCLFRIIYPPEMQVTNELLQIQGTGFFEPLGGVVNFIADIDNNIVTVTACQKNFGQTTSGILTLSKVRNQAWQRDLSNFKVLMAYETDDTFEQPFQIQLGDFKILKDQQKPGYMTGRVKGTQTLVQTFSSLLIYVKPSISLNTSSYITITIPNSLQFNGPSCTISESKGFSKLINCNRDQQLVTIRNLFDSYYDASIGSELFMRVEDFTLPLSVQPVGVIDLKTWDFRENKMTIIDQILLDNMTLTAGKIIKLSEVNVNTQQTSQINQIYTFHFKITHRIEVGGFFRIFLSEDEKNGVQISDPEMVKQNCFLVQSGGNTGVPCISGKTDDEIPLPYVNINCSSVNFGDDGAQKDQELKFQIKGLQNPRLINYQSYFQIYTTDEKLYPIDQSFDDQKFSVMMTEMSEINSVSVQPVSNINGEITDYSIVIIPITQVWTDDAFQIVFPPEITLPTDCNCISNDIYITGIECFISGDNKIIFHFIEIQKEHQALQALKFNISNIKNPISTRTTSNFTDIILYDYTNVDYQFQKYEQSVNVTTNQTGQIDKSQVIYTQSSYNTGQNSTNFIQFQTNNPLPKNTAIILQIPAVFEKFYTDNCQIILDGRIIKQSDDQVITCQINDRQLWFLNFFSTEEVFTGTVRLQFKLKNPDLNTLDITQSPYSIQIFDDPSFQYGIDDLNNWPIPSLGCAYPCNTCYAENKDYCLSCINSDDAPQFLHFPRGSQVQTCVKKCPKEDGFTSNGSRNPRKCIKCGDTCQECAQNDQPGDINLCTICKPNFQYFWQNTSLCFGNSCPDGTFQSGNQIDEDGHYKCLTCFQPCKSCTDRQICTKCNAGGPFPYLLRETCVKECPSEQTTVGGKCTPCRLPCRTCSPNSPDSCTSCKDPNRLFLFGYSCLATCPNGTTENKSIPTNFKCFGCNIGCKQCDQGDNSICLACQPGLSLLNSTCRSECPPEYKKSSDGSTCELRTYPLDKNFVAFPFCFVAMFFTMITLASFWLTGKRSLVSSSLIAFYGPIEMAASLYQALYAAAADRNYRPILIGSSFAFAAGMIVNITFFGVYQKQIKGKDKLFERWRKQKWCIANFYLWIATFFSVNIYRLIFCQLFRLEIMSVKVSRPQPFLRPLLIFGFIKFLVFNFPLLITNFLGISILEWGNQCYMTMLESTILSFLTLLLMIWEYFLKEYLIVRENIQLSMKNLENIDEHVHLKNEDEDGGKFSSFGGRKKKVNPGFDDNFFGQTSSGFLLSRQDRGAISLNNIKFQLQNNVTMSELKDAEGRRQPSARSLTRRIDFFLNIVNIVKQNIGLVCNGDIDDLLNAQIDEKKKQTLRRNNSMRDIDTRFEFKKPINEAQEEEEIYDLMDQQDLLEKQNPNIYKDKNEDEIQEIKNNLEVRPRRYSFPNCDLFVDRDEKMKLFLEYLESIRQLAIDQNTRGNQYIDPIDDNVYASARDPPPEIIVTEVEVQTYQEKDNRGENEEFQNRAKDQAREALNEQIFENLMADQNKKKAQKKRKKGFRGGKGSSYKLVLNEDDEESAEKSDKESQAAIPTDLNIQNFKPVNSRYAMKVPENHQSSGVNMLTLAMQVEQNYSTTGLYDLYQAEEERKMKLGLVQEDTDFLNPVFAVQSVQFQSAQGLNLSRVSGDLDFSEGEEEEAQKAAQKKKIENVQAWISDETEGVNQRTFNENDIVGNFERDWSGAIVDREYTLKKMKYRDKDGNLVNNRGYLIDEITGDIRSKYTFELVFKSYDLIGIGKNKVELPLPYRLERHNFNPHQCMGNFDYSILDEPIILKDQYGNRIDKNFRKVNKVGWLVDEIGNVVDNQGRVRFLVQQLQENGEIPNLFNYEGYEYSIKSIIGIFEKNTKSKEIILCKTKQNKNSLKTHYCDLKYRRVNPKGYLLDERGNIVDNKNHIIWHQHQLMFNEPQKIFSFSEFSINWIRGTLDRDVTLNQKHDDEYDLNGNRINTMGYLIDDYDNVVDVFSQSILFKKEALKGMYGMESEIPKIFREGKLKRPPDDDPIEKLLQKTHDRARKGKHKVVAPGNFNLDQDKKDSSTDEDPFDITEYNYNENETGKINLQKLQKAQKGKYGKQKDGRLAGLLSPDGREIDSIEMNSQQQILVGDSRILQFEEDQSEESKRIRPKTGKVQNQNGNGPGVAARSSSAVDKRQSKLK